MKSPLLLALALTTALPAVLSAQAATSGETNSKIRAVTPGYDPAVHAAEEARKAAQAREDEDIVVMEEMTVQEKSVRRLEEETLFKKGAWDKELVKREQSELDRYFLNRYTLSVSAGAFTVGVAGAQSSADRAREAYSERKNREFKERAENYSDVLKSTDEKEASDLKTLMLDTAKSGQRVESSARPSNWR